MCCILFFDKFRLINSIPIQSKHKYNYYKLLSVSERADSLTIKRSFRDLAKKYHPDKNSSETAKEYFQLLNEAYQVLTDPIKREQYDIATKSGTFTIKSKSNSDIKSERREERKRANYDYSYNLHKAPEIWTPPKWVKIFFYLVGSLFGLFVNYFSFYHIIEGKWNPIMLVVNVLATIVLLDALGGLFLGEALFSERLMRKVKSWFVPKF